MNKLYIVATPIGNLEDFSFRALRILKEVDLILCEDTRVTKKLLNKYEIQTKTISYHQHSKLSKLKFILENLKNKKDLALVSDAGTPCISDPGSKLIDDLINNLPELKVISIPGPSALVSALSISGVPVDKFIFLGFPPVKNKRKKFFKNISKLKYTSILYESPHRILKTLEELKDILNLDRKIIVCKELTKKFEKVYRGNIKQVIQELKQDKIKGEFVIIIHVN